MDDIKLISRSEQDTDSRIHLTRLCSEDIRMSVGLEKLQQQTYRTPTTTLVSHRPTGSMIKMEDSTSADLSCQYKCPTGHQISNWPQKSKQDMPQMSILLTTHSPTKINEYQSHNPASINPGTLSPAARVTIIRRYPRILLCQMYS